MKQTLKTKSTAFKKRHDERGVAIITVLSVLMLMTVMVVSFFSLASNELNASRSTAEGLRAVSAKDVAVNLAIAQIREATTREGTIWVSQPGAIRVYGNRTRSGTADSIYKLYSSSAMIAASFKELQRDMPQDWNQNQVQFVDLNRPVINPDPTDPENIARATIHFPIVDPRAFKGKGQQGSVEGFSYETRGVPGIVAGGQDHQKRLPMPVQWLYVLADGSIGYMDRGNRFVGKIQPTKENPITSRIAFWTDDESSKVNVNTASEGVYWDTPRVDTKEDRRYAAFQPQNGEFQRYPAHPAQNCLSTVLFPNEGNGGSSSNRRLDPDNARDLDKMKALWTIGVGIGTGGSVGGTQKVDVDEKEAMPAEPRDFHLYTSPEEILFETDMRSGKRIVHKEITQEKLEISKFFLTARSRAPETTMLGRPRMSMWPMATSKGNRTAFDDAIAFCTTINRRPYFFQRENAYSRHNEFYGNAGGRNNIMYEALKNITSDPIPGFGSSFGAKYGSGKFDDRNNLLAETLDYYRGTNLYDPLLRTQYTNGSTNDKARGHGQIAAICLCDGTGPHSKRWFNSRLPMPKGFGRMIGLSEFALMLVQRAEWKLPDPNDPEDKGSFIGDDDDQKEEWDNGGKMIPGTQLIQLGILVEGFAPSHGWTSLQPQNTIAIGGGAGNRDSDVPKSFYLGNPGYQLKRGRAENSDYPKATTTLNSKRPQHWVSWGGYGGVRMFNKIITFEPVVIPNTVGTIEFGGSTARDPVRVILYDSINASGGLDTGNLIQSYQLSFPKATFKTPNWWAGPNSQTKNSWYSFESRMKNAIANGVDWLYSETRDVVHSLVPSHGDYRLLTSKRVVEPSSFVKHPKYGSSDNMAHALTDYTSSQSMGVQLLPGGSFDKENAKDFIGLSYPKGIAPDFPIGPSSEDWANDVVSREGRRRAPYEPAITGDFDTGVGNAPDGAYINRPDDGDSRGGLGRITDAPYFDNNRDRRKKASAMFSPNRVIPSSGMLGSLSTGVQANVPWQTLLFRPMDPRKHFGARELPDHLWMDYFWMPIVQPYVISEPFSTAGKINLNYQIVPFQYIRRATGLHAVMKAEKMLAIPNSAIDSYKTGGRDEDWRKFIDIEETLKQWDEKFEDGEAFRSASEICDMYLVPDGERWSSRRKMEGFWDDHRVTGDNVKERPYTNMYPRLTVRSNTFKVHLVAQSIIKVKSTEPDTFDELRDKIAGEYRGSAIIERSISPNDEDIPDYASNISRGDNPPSLDLFYTYRIVNEKRFAP